MSSQYSSHADHFKAVTEYLSGNTAVATYNDTYDILIMGERRAHTIIATDTSSR
jgi:hypothetical protein